MHICISLQGEGEGRAHDDAEEEGSHPLLAAAGGLTLGTHLHETHTHFAPAGLGWKVLLSWKILEGQIINHKSICLKIILKGFVVCLGFFKASPPSLLLPLPDRNPGGVFNLLDQMQKARAAKSKDYSSWVCSFLMIYLKTKFYVKIHFFSQNKARTWHTSVQPQRKKSSLHCQSDTFLPPKSSGKLKRTLHGHK